MLVVKESVAREETGFFADVAGNTVDIYIKAQLELGARATFTFKYGASNSIAALTDCNCYLSSAAGTCTYPYPVCKDACTAAHDTQLDVAVFWGCVAHAP